MEVLIILLFALSLMLFSIQLAIFPKHIFVYIWSFILMAFIYLLYPTAINQSYIIFKQMLDNSSLMSDFVVVQVVEGVCGVLLSVFLMHCYYNEIVKYKFLRYAVYLPGIVVFVAVFYLSVYFYLNVYSMSFAILAIVLAIAIPLFLLVLSKLINHIINDYDLLLELKFILHVLQIVLAVILSAVLFRIPVNNSPDNVFLMPLLTLFVIFSLFVILGVLRFKKRKYF